MIPTPFSLDAKRCLIITAKFLGFQLGADRVLADFGQIRAYFGKLAEETPRLPHWREGLRECLREIGR